MVHTNHSVAAIMMDHGNHAQEASWRLMIYGDVSGQVDKGPISI